MLEDIYNIANSTVLYKIQPLHKCCAFANQGGQGSHLAYTDSANRLNFFHQIN